MDDRAHIVSTNHSNLIIVWPNLSCLKAGDLNLLVWIYRLKVETTESQSSESKRWKRKQTKSRLRFLASSFEVQIQWLGKEHESKNRVSNRILFPNKFIFFVS